MSRSAAAQLAARLGDSGWARMPEKGDGEGAARLQRRLARLAWAGEERRGAAHGENRRGVRVKGGLGGGEG